jgi:hypothetical protein
MSKDNTEGNLIRMQDGTPSSESEYVAKVFLSARTSQFCWEIPPLPKSLDIVQDCKMVISQSYATRDQGKEGVAS